VALVDSEEVFDFRCSICFTATIRFRDFKLFDSKLWDWKDGKLTWNMKILD